MNTITELRTQAIIAVCNELKYSAVDFGIVNGVIQYPTSIGRDIDILVPKKHFGTALATVVRTLKQAGFSLCVFDTKYGLTMCHAWRLEGEEIWGVQIDLFTEFLWAGCLLAGNCERKEEQVFIGPFPVDPWGAFAKTFLLQLLCGNLPKALANCEALSVLWQNPACGKIITKELCRLCDRDTAEKIWQAVVNKDDFTIENLQNTLRKEVIWHSYCMGFPGNLRYIVRWIGWKLAIAMAGRYVPIIAVIGPDIEKKKALIDNLRNEIQRRLVFPKVYIHHWNPHNIPCQESGTTLLQKLKVVCSLWKEARISFLKDQARSKQYELTLYEHSWIDVARERLCTMGGNFLSPYWIATLFPSPDFVILLDSGEKPDKSGEDKSQSWKELAIFYPNHLIIDPSLSLESISRLILGHIGRTFLNLH